MVRCYVDVGVKQVVALVGFGVLGRGGVGFEQQSMLSSTSPLLGPMKDLHNTYDMPDHILKSCNEGRIALCELASVN